MKVIVDTNVLVSAIICDNIPEQVIMWIVSQPVIEWVATAEIVREYKDVLQRKKFNLPSDVIDSWLSLLDEELVLVSPKMEVNFPRDVKDAKFLDCALESNADIFITGDRDFSEAQALISTQIMSVSQFKLFIG
ncbi:MAG: putative toxin-antitoxin system toxin component, PIN family [Methylococcales bacterium]|nr:putative toxin-antitoxin system toxin component, PIN family [Methylococcales bacterium]